MKCCTSLCLSVSVVQLLGCWQVLLTMLASGDAAERIHPDHAPCSEAKRKQSRLSSNTKQR